jgi:hypothetical protein
MGMGTRKSLFLSLVVMGALSGAAPAQTQTADQTQAQPAAAAPANAPVTTVDQAMDRIIAREHQEIGAIRRSTPIIETYIQEMKLDKDLGAVPSVDHYFLGQANLSRGVVDNSILTDKKGKGWALNPLTHLTSFFSSGFVPAGFLQMVFVDPNGFDRQHYQFQYIGKEFLGGVRCFVFDVRPLPKSGKGRFSGRIWAEDQNFTIVRFNGVYLPLASINGYNLHFDSWRLNVQPGFWVPSFIFSEESNMNSAGLRLRFKSQTRLWGYDLQNVSRESEFTNLTIESPNANQDQAISQTDRTPLEAEREWQHEAEVNVLERLQRVGLLAPPGEVDKVMETVVNNLEVTNNVDVEPEVHCRVLLTTTLESFTIGHTIVVSRGLLDVLPDEASLATMLAQELADIIVTKPSTDQWGFNDMTNVSTAEALSHFSFRDTPEQVQLVSEKALDLLKNSPYKDKLGTAGLFLKDLSAQSGALQGLINPHIGNRVFLSTQLISSASTLQPTKVDQISALPIGARVKLNPWTDQVELLKAKALPLTSAREKMPFEITPFMPYLSYYQKPGSGDLGAAATADLAGKVQQQQQPQQPQ